MAARSGAGWRRSLSISLRCCSSCRRTRQPPSPTRRSPKISSPHPCRPEHTTERERGAPKGAPNTRDEELLEVHVAHAATGHPGAGTGRLLLGLVGDNRLVGKEQRPDRR